MEELSLPSDTGQQHQSLLCDSPPSRRQPSRWQQLKSGWGDVTSSSTPGSDQDASVVRKSSCWLPASPEQQQAADTGIVGDSLQRSTDCTGSQLRVGPDGSLAWGDSSSAEGDAVCALLKLLQETDPDSNTWDALPEMSSQQATNARDQQHLDLAGAFEYLQQQPQQQQSKSRTELPANSRGRDAHSHSSNGTNTAGSKQPRAFSTSSTGPSSRGGTRGAAAVAQQPSKALSALLRGSKPSTGQQPSHHVSPGSLARSKQHAGAGAARAPPSAAAALAATTSMTRARQAAAGGGSATPRVFAGYSTTSNSRQPPARPALQGSSKAAAAARRTAPSNPAACLSGPLTAANTSTCAMQQPRPAAQHTLQQEVSNTSRTSSSSSGGSSLREAQAELQLELRAVVQFRLLRRWRLAAADTALDRARARPMCNLLSKRKAMRAWQLIMAARSINPQARLPVPQQQPHPAASQQQLLSQPSQRGVKAMQVASQFHRLYRSHCCLLHWHAWAVAAADARRQEQAQQLLEERQRALAQQQEELLAEFQRRQQQELQQQQERTRLEVAARFHGLFMLHSALRTWFKHASMAAALRKLHPPLPPAHSTVAAGGQCTAGIVAGETTTGAMPAGPPAAAAVATAGEGAGGRSRGVHGLLDPAVVQQKAQLLLQHLASRGSAAADSPQQPQQQHGTQQLQQVCGAVKAARAGAGKVMSAKPASQQQQRQHGKQGRGELAAAAADKQLQQAAAAPPPPTTQREGCVLQGPQQEQQAASDGAVSSNTMPAAAAGGGEQLDLPAVAAAAMQQPEAPGLLQDCMQAINSCSPTQLRTSSCSTQAAQQQQQHGGVDGQSLTLAAAASAVNSDSPSQKAASAEEAVHPSTQHPALPAKQQPVLQESIAACVSEGTEQAAAAAAAAGKLHQPQPQQQRPTQGAGLPRAPRIASKAQHSNIPARVQQQQKQPPHVRASAGGPHPTAAGPAASNNPQAEEQQQQQHQQEELLSQQQQQWPLERARLQQQLRQLQAEEQRRARQYQQVEQQLQAVLAAQAAELAGVHACRALARRVSLGPWLGLMRQRAQQWQLAGRLYQCHLLSGAMGAFKLALVCRHKRHTCQHVRAWGKLRSVCQQRQQSAALSALHTWAVTRQHYRRQLLLRCVAGWRGAAAEGAQLAAAAAGAMRAFRQQQVVAAWWAFVQDQAHEQLLVELESAAMADGWHTARVARCTLRGWGTAAAASVQQRVQEAAHQQTWSRVRGWLSELDGPGGQQGPAAGAGAAAAAGCSGQAAELLGAWDVDSVGPEVPAAAGGLREGDVEAWDECLELGVHAAGEGGGLGSPSGESDDMAALAEWFEAAGRNIGGLSGDEHFVSSGGHAQP